jgi:orotate phosphoribosyltransferase
MTKTYSRYDDQGSNLTARYLLERGAVHIRPDDPFRFTSGRISPIYVDVRCIYGGPRARADIISMSCAKIYAEIKSTTFQTVAGGETAGIPLAAWIADRLDKPMAYIRKEAKSFGRGAQIEGLTQEEVEKSNRFLLCEDLLSEGGSKQNFINVIRQSGNIITDCFVIFSYGIFGAEDKLRDEGVSLCALCNASMLVDVAEDLQAFPPEIITTVRTFLADPNCYSD